ncbi:hypothetical protein GGG16DRAFT_41098, partial [Schizophyllum commune]
LDDTPPGPAVFRLYAGLSRPDASLLTQLRTGHIGLNANLNRIGLSPTPRCPHCGMRETITHYV